jgi:ABC-type branched-subunit amino acid transport system substrate-binding protein
MKTAKKWSKQNDSWRNATSYDATQAFIKAINLSTKIVTRKETLNQLNSD